MQAPLKIGTAVLALFVSAPTEAAVESVAAVGHALAANHGVWHRQYRLVQLFSSDPSHDTARSLNDLKKSAEQGDSNAQYMLGLAYDVGVGATQDFAMAATWYRKAAERGHAGAQFNLGHLYADGRGVTQDFVQAHMWLNLAAAGSQAGARTERDLVAKRMTRSQLAEALRLAREWQPKPDPSRSENSSPSEPANSIEDRNRPP